MGMVKDLPVRFDIYFVNLDPTIGSEIKKTRPCVIISPNEMNKYLNTVLIAPLTSVKRAYPSRVDCKLQGKKGEIALDQIRAIVKKRLVKKVGKLPKQTSVSMLDVLVDMFSI